MIKKSSLFRIIVLSGLLNTLAACQSSLPPLPTKPTLNMMAVNDGGLCLDSESTRRLSIYILELERGYKQ